MQGGKVQLMLLISTLSKLSADTISAMIGPIDAEAKPQHRFLAAKHLQAPWDLLTGGKWHGLSDLRMATSAGARTRSLRS